MKTILACALVGFVCLSAVARGGECCAHCGCNCDCQKVCRLVCETKKVPKTEYDCECEDFCVPGKSDHCKVCDECGHWKHIYTPTCAEVRTRVKLVKKETTTEKKVYKWVVEKVCCDCAAKVQQQTGPANASVAESLPAVNNGDVQPASYQGGPQKPGNPSTADSQEASAADAQKSRAKFDPRGLLPSFLGGR